MIHDQHTNEVYERTAASVLFALFAALELRLKSLVDFSLRRGRLSVGVAQVRRTRTLMPSKEIKLSDRPSTKCTRLFNDPSKL